MTAIAPRDLALLLAVTLVWGLNLVVSKYGLTEIPPILFTTMRFALLAIVLAPWLRLHVGFTNAIVVAALLSGGLAVALTFMGIARAETVTSVAIAAQLGVPFTTLLSIALLGEVVRWRRWIGIALAFAGVCIMGFDPRVFDNASSLAFVVAAAFVGALGLIAVKRLPPMSPLDLQAWIGWVSWPILLVLSLTFERPTLATFAQITWIGWSALLFTALAATLFAHTVFFYLVQRYPVTSVAPLTVLSPVFSVIFGITLLGDTLTLRLALGGACTLLGVLIITLREHRIVDTVT